MSEPAREVEIALPITGDVFLESFESSERFSELFSMTAIVICAEEVDFFPYLGQAATITMNVAGSPVRYFNGMIATSRFLNIATTGYRYEITLAPWLQKLSRNLDYNIFQNLNALDIIQAVFSSRSCADFDLTKLSNTTLNIREYCVQYRESDFAFISRLMEEEGIYYFFKHSDGKHVMVLCDGRRSHAASAYPSLPFIEHTGAARAWTACVNAWHEQVSTGLEGDVALRDFFFVNPTLQVAGSYAAGEKISTETAEVYDYPGGFNENSLGNELSQTRLEAARRERRLYLGSGEAPALACGDILTLDDHWAPRFSQDYLIVGLRHSASGQNFASTGVQSELAEVHIEAIPAATQWRAPLTTPKPVARGPETAIVTGPDGEILYTDKYGRVKVRFHWDRSTSAPDKTTCFIRVSNGSAGNGFGVVMLPRIGQEVIVDFLDGDPDRPMITGRVYNGSQLVPDSLPDYQSVPSQATGLPDNKTVQMWRSQTVGSTGSYDGAETPPSSPSYNEISMEDNGGSERLYFYAQRVREAWVRLDDLLKVERDQTRSIRRNRTTNIMNNDTITIEKGDESHTVSQGKRVTSIQQNEELTVVQGDMKTTVSAGDRSTTVSEGNDATKVSMGDMSIDVAMGNYSLKTDMGSVNVEAMQQIVLKVGQSSITITQEGVTIQGMMLSSQAQVSLEAKGLMIDIEGSALTTVKGGIVMIN
jgi:type VI secretion system secreted protein VgrG